MAMTEACPYCEGTGYFRPDQAPVEAGSLRMNIRCGEYSWRGVPLHLTPTQAEIILRLVRAKGAVVATAGLVKSVNADDKALNNVSVHICMLRKKFRKIDPDFKALVNQWGAGYAWREHEQH